MRCYVWKPCSDQRWQDKLWFSIWRFFEQSALINIHLLCYWQTIYNLPWCWSRRSVLNFKLSVFTILRSMSCWAAALQCSMSIEQKLCKVKVFQLQSTSNAIRCINQRFAFKNFVSGLEIQLEKSEYNSPVCKKIGCRWRNTTSHVSFSPNFLYKQMA